MVERGDDAAGRQDGRRLLRGAARLDGQGVGTQLVEPDGVDAVDDHLAGQRVGEADQQIAVTLVGDGDDDEVGSLGRSRVVGSGDVEVRLRAKAPRPPRRAQIPGCRSTYADPPSRAGAPALGPAARCPRAPQP